jgi:hypothetical protein
MLHSQKLNFNFWAEAMHTLYMSLTELGFKLMKEKQPMNFGQARSPQLGISKCLYALHMHLCPKS